MILKHIDLYTPAAMAFLCSLQIVCMEKQKGYVVISCERDTLMRKPQKLHSINSYNFCASQSVQSGIVSREIKEFASIVQVSSNPLISVYVSTGVQNYGGMWAHLSFYKIYALLETVAMTHLIKMI